MNAQQPMDADKEPGTDAGPVSPVDGALAGETPPAEVPPPAVPPEATPQLAPSPSIAAAASSTGAEEEDPLEESSESDSEETAASGSEIAEESDAEESSGDEADSEGVSDHEPDEVESSDDEADSEEPSEDEPNAEHSSEDEHDAEESSEGEPEAEAEGEVPTDPDAEEADSRGVLKLPPRAEGSEESTLLARHEHVAPAVIPLEFVDEDPLFQLRPEGDTALLATDLARLGQLFPIDLRQTGPDRYQVICGFRRVAALRFLQRDHVLARVHTELGDEDALLMGLADALHYVPVSREELDALRAKLEEEGRLGSEARDMLDKALSAGDELSPEHVDEEVDADELAAKVAQQLGDINQDLALLADVFGSLDAAAKETLLQQLRYSAELVTFLEGK